MATGDLKGMEEVAGPLFTEVNLKDKFPYALEVRIMKQLTQAEYTALTPKIDTTLYLIVG